MSRFTTLSLPGCMVVLTHERIYGGTMQQGYFAVIDTETTGLFPGGHDRIAEIAIVTLDRRGVVVDRWETLINPGRDLGKQSLHKIQARDILEAPTFADIADEISWRLSGTVVTAHNLSFDARFLDAEFRRAGQPLPDFYFPRGLCTMRMAHEYLPGAGRSLQDCCDSFGIALENAHCAGDDAEATAVLLSRYMELDAQLSDWDILLNEATSTGWRHDPPAQLFPPAMRSTGAREGQHFLERIVVSMPEYTGPAEHEEYLALLDRALLDSYLSAHEEALLVQTANELGISRSQAAILHAQYFNEVVAAAWSDGVLTVDEMQDLEKIAVLLQVSPDALEAARQPREVRVPSGPGNADKESDSSFRSPLQPGDMVVLTGDMSKPRDDIEGHLRDAGYVPHRAVTKKVKLLVAADPDSLSGKARKARDYGIPVVGEDYLWRALANVPDHNANLATR